MYKRQGIHKRFPSLQGFPLHIGTVSDVNYIFAACIYKLLSSQAAAHFIIAGHTAYLMLEMSVYGNQRHIRLQIFIRIAVGNGNQAVYLVLFCHIDIGKLPVLITMGIAYKQLIADRRQHLLHIVHQQGKKWVD